MTAFFSQITGLPRFFYIDIFSTTKFKLKFGVTLVILEKFERKYVKDLENFKKLKQIFQIKLKKKGKITAVLFCFAITIKICQKFRIALRSNLTKFSFCKLRGHLLPHDDRKQKSPLACSFANRPLNPFLCETTYI